MRKEIDLFIQDVIVKMPQPLYQRFQQVAHATHQSLDDVIVRAMEAGSPPSWEEAPPEFQADLAVLDRLDDTALWRIARSSQLTEDTTCYQELLDQKANGQLTPTERIELSQLRKAADRFLLWKAYAVDLLRWRCYAIPQLTN